MSQELRIDLEMLWADLSTDKEFYTDRGLIRLGEILGYRCNNLGYKIETDEGTK